MQQKKKLCSGCNTEQYIWKREGRDRYCQRCWGKIKSKDPDAPKLNPVSQRKASQDKTYSLLRKDFLSLKPFCEARLPGCTNQSTDVHHTYFGNDRDKYYLITSTWKSVCRSCHNTIHDKLSAEELIKLGLKRKD
jgi:hypothetical protein